jgi:hypothetical protein
MTRLSASSLSISTMGFRSAIVSFASEVPTVPVILLALRQHTGEEVGYDELKWELFCQSMDASIGLIPPEEGEDLRYLLGSTYLGGSYLWDATLLVLQTLGGTYPYPIPEQASKPWLLAQQWYQRPIPKITSEELQRLGFE